MYSDYERAVSGLNAVQGELWSIAENSDVGIDLKLRTLALLTQTYGKTMQGTKTRRDIKQWVRESRRQEPSTLIEAVSDPKEPLQEEGKEMRRSTPAQRFNWLEE